MPHETALSKSKVPLEQDEHGDNLEETTPDNNNQVSVLEVVCLAPKKNMSSIPIIKTRMDVDQLQQLGHGSNGTCIISAMSNGSHYKSKQIEMGESGRRTEDGERVAMAKLVQQLVTKEKLHPKRSVAVPVPTSPTEMNPNANVSIKTTRGVEMRRVDSKVPSVLFAPTTRPKQIPKSKLKRKSVTVESSPVSKARGISHLGTDKKRELGESRNTHALSDGSKLFATQSTSKVVSQEKKNSQVLFGTSLNVVGEEVEPPDQQEHHRQPPLDEKANGAAEAVTDVKEVNKISSYYKSSFWNYIKKAEESTPCHATEKHKTYDSKVVHSYIAKQKELRRKREMEEVQARQKQLDKKKKDLLELQTKCRNIARSKRKTVVKELMSGQPPIAERPPYTKAIPPDTVQGKSSKQRQQLLAAVKQRKRISVTLRRTPESAEGTTSLEEFQSTIRPQDGIGNEHSFQTHKSALQFLPCTDKGVEVEAIKEILMEGSRSGSSCSSSSTVVSVRNKVQDFNQAASRIQATFKGHLQRRILKEAGVDPTNFSKLVDNFPSTWSRGYQVEPVERELNVSRDTEGRALSTRSLNVAALPSCAQQDSFEPHKKLRKSFNEPYPREIIQRLQEEEAAASSSRRNSLCDIRKSSLLKDCFRNSFDGSVATPPFGTPKSSKKKEALIPLRKSEGLRAFHEPSISAVLIEKLRLLQNEQGSVGLGADLIFPSRNFESNSEKDLSISSISRGSLRSNSVPASADVTITDDYFGPSESEKRRTRTSTPIQHTQSGHLRSKSESADSSTTVETDAELSNAVGLQNHMESWTVDTSEVSGFGTKQSASDSVHLPVTALKLQYQAEKERLHILEKAQRAAAQSSQYKSPMRFPTVPSKTEIEEIAKKVTDEKIQLKMAELEKEKWAALIKQHEQVPLGTLQLEMMKCHQEAAKATAEVSRWAVEMVKSMLESRQQESLNYEYSKWRIIDDPTTQRSGKYRESFVSHEDKDENVPNQMDQGEEDKIEISGKYSVSFVSDEHKDENAPDQLDQAEEDKTEGSGKYSVSFVSDGDKGGENAPDEMDQGEEDKIERSGKYSVSFVSDEDKNENAPDEMNQGEEDKIERSGIYNESFVSDEDKEENLADHTYLQAEEDKIESSEKYSMSFMPDEDTEENVPDYMHQGEEDRIERSEKYSESFVSDEDKEENLPDHVDLQAEEDKIESSEKYNESFVSYEGKEENLLPDHMDVQGEEDKIESSDKDDSIAESSISIEELGLEENEEGKLLSEDVKLEEDQLDERKELSDLAQQQKKVEDEIKELEAQIVSPIDDYLSALEERRDAIWSKPPPPYSSPAFEAFLQAIETFDASPNDETLREIISTEVDKVWVAWLATGKVPPERALKDAEQDQRRKEEELDDYEDAMVEKYTVGLTNDIRNSAVAVVRDSIQQILRVKQLTTAAGFVDTCRKGMYALEALEYKLPKTKEALISSVYKLVVQYYSETCESVNPHPEKWCCKPRDVVENVLVGEMIEEEPQWVDIWPEAMLMTDQIAYTILEDCIVIVQTNFEIAMKDPDV